MADLKLPTVQLVVALPSQEGKVVELSFVVDGRPVAYAMSRQVAATLIAELARSLSRVDA